MEGDQSATPVGDDRDIEANKSRIPKSRRKKASAEYNASYRPWEAYQMGYPRFAAFISEDKDKSSTIYRRFERLAARNLLYLESELAELEAKQDELDEEYRKESFDSRMTARSWKELRKQAPETFYDINDVKGLSSVLDGEEHEKELPEITEDTPVLVLPGSQPPESRSALEMRGSNSGAEEKVASRKRLLLAYRIRAVLKEYCKSILLLSFQKYRFTMERQTKR